jgi:predicted CxxxxCH...CXXCH cytochrome family protein
MRSQALATFLALTALSIAACDARPASPGGDPLPVSGAHTVHLTGTALAEPIICSQCHNPQFEVTLQGPLASANGAQGTFNTTTLTCSNVYCHAGGPGLPIGGGTVPVPTWNPPSVVVCGSCHSLPGAGEPTPWHPAVAAGVQCGLCHPGYTNTSVVQSLHVNGVANLTAPDLGTNCAACHGDASRVLPDGMPAVVKAAPPVDRNGSSATTQVGVGAHQAHLLPGANAISSPIACGECHVVPTDLAHVGPVASTPATLAWGPLASSNGAVPGYDATQVTCANYSHGQTLGTSGSNTQPTWTVVDGSQAACGTCHGQPPFSGAHQLHVGGIPKLTCGVCHPTGYTNSAVGAAVVAIHVNGAVNMNVVPSAPGAPTFANWNPAAAGPGGWLGTSTTGCHGGTKYWFPGSSPTCQ